jgi:hypothetical protein
MPQLIRSATVRIHVAQRRRVIRHSAPRQVLMAAAVAQASGAVNRGWRGRSVRPQAWAERASTANQCRGRLSDSVLRGCQCVIACTRRSALQPRDGLSMQSRQPLGHPTPTPATAPHSPSVSAALPPA